MGKTHTLTRTCPEPTPLEQLRPGDRVRYQTTRMTEERDGIVASASAKTVELADGRIVTCNDYITRITRIAPVERAAVAAAKPAAARIAPFWQARLEAVILYAAAIDAGRGAPAAVEAVNARADLLRRMHLRNGKVSVHTIRQHRKELRGMGVPVPTTRAGKAMEGKAPNSRRGVADESPGTGSPGAGVSRTPRGEPKDRAPAKGENVSKTPRGEPKGRAPAKGDHVSKTPCGEPKGRVPAKGEHVSKTPCGEPTDRALAKACRYAMAQAGAICPPGGSRADAVTQVLASDTWPGHLPEVTSDQVLACWRDERRRAADLLGDLPEAAACDEEVARETAGHPEHAALLAANLRHVVAGLSRCLDERAERTRALARRLIADGASLASGLEDAHALLGDPQ